MRYFGGKAKIAKRLVPVIAGYLPGHSAFVEPFVGAANIMCAIPRDVRRIGGDANVALVNMWRALGDGWVPPEAVSEAEYYELKKKKDVHDPLTAFAGFGCAFGGDWFTGYARDDATRKYCQNSRNSVLRKNKTLDGVEWFAGSYVECSIPENSLIYCDPPYAGVQGYAAVGAFDSRAFWEWCRDRAWRGHTVLVSEYNAPEDFELVWHTQSVTEMHTKTGREPRVEKLFRARGV